MAVEATSPLVEAQIERALAPVRDLVPPDVLGEMRRLLEDMLTAHPPVARLATRLGPNPRAVTSGAVLAPGSEGAIVPGGKIESGR